MTRANDVSSPPLELDGGMPFYEKKYYTVYVSAVRTASTRVESNRTDTDRNEMGWTGIERNAHHADPSQLETHTYTKGRSLIRVTQFDLKFMKPRTSHQ